MRYHALTKHEVFKIQDLAEDGLNNEQIAARLDRAPATISKVTSTIYTYRPSGRRDP